MGRRRFDRRITWIGQGRHNAEQSHICVKQTRGGGRDELRSTCFYLHRELYSTSSRIIAVAKSPMKSSFQPDDLMTILDGIDDAVVKLDGHANFMAMNQAAANIYQRLGFDPKSMKGKSVWEVFPELKGSLIERELRQVLEDHV